MTQTVEVPPVATDSVYVRLGGAPAIRALVKRLYELMDELPEAYTVRRLDPDSLAGSADSLFKFLSGWFGGPTSIAKSFALCGSLCPQVRERTAIATIETSHLQARLGNQYCPQGVMNIDRIATPLSHHRGFK
jgi:truncated hemoglobin YjbI